MNFRCFLFKIGPFSGVALQDVRCFKGSFLITISNPCISTLIHLTVRSLDAQNTRV